MPMPELTSGYAENLLNKARKILFVNSYIFMSKINISSRLYQPNCWNSNDKI